jgi:putative ABC transport system permease protein
MLSTALITVVANVASSIQQTMLQYAINETGNYIYSINNITTNQIKDTSVNRNVSDIYVKKYVGVGKLEQPKYTSRPYIYVSAFNKEAFEDGFNLELKQGRFPKNSNEIVLANNVLAQSLKKYSVGDTITFSLGDKYCTEKDEEIVCEPDKNTDYDVGYLKNTKEKTYKIVGILKDNISRNVEAESGSANCNAFTLYTGEEITENESRFSYIYVNFTDSGKKNYLEIISQLTGVSADTIHSCYSISDGATDEQWEEYDSYFGNSDVFINTSVLTRQGIDLSDDTNKTLMIIVGVVVVIIILSSVFVIRNSFAISITEKTGLYGMMASIGATSRQIRHNVLFEGLVLGIIGIPLGLCLGYGITGGLIALLNILLAEALENMPIIFGTNLWAVALAVVSGVLTIFFSSIFTAVRVSKISPVTAIRGNKDVKITRHQKKYYKTPKYITKLFGVGGSIAYKSLKRSKKKYRTTVISIIVSVILFISMSAFISYGFGYLNIQEETQLNYNLYFSVENNKDAERNINTIVAMDEVNSYYRVANDYQLGYIKSKWIDVNEDIFDAYDVENYGEYSGVDLTVMAFDDDTYKEILEKAGYSYDEVKNKGIIYNSGSNDEIQLNVPKNTKINLYDSYEVDDNGNFSKIRINYSVNIAGTFSELPDNNELFVPSGGIIVSKDWFYNNVGSSGWQVYISTDNPDKIQEAINDIDTDIYVLNYQQQIRIQKAVVLTVSIFIYGFIIVVSLIGVTNIFNTITTNMKLRQKEFAMLCSIGMTKKEFNKMVNLESFMYGFKSLIIGLPIGILGNFGIFYGFSQDSEMVYTFPLCSVLITIAFVFVVVWGIMMYSLSKIKNQNIIETIRNDNI